MSFLERIARRALDLEDGPPRAVAKDLALRPGFIPPLAAPPATTGRPPAETPPSGDGAAFGGPPGGDASPASAPMFVARQTSPLASEDEEEPDEEGPARTVRAQRQVADEEPEDDEEPAQPLRRQPADEPEREVEEEPEELRTIRRRTAPEAAGLLVAGATPPVPASPDVPTRPSGHEPPAPAATPPDAGRENAGSDQSPRPAGPAGIEGAEPGAHAAEGLRSGDASAPAEAAEEGLASFADARFEAPVAEPAPPAGDRRPPSRPWPFAAERPAAAAPPARPDVVIEHIDVVVSEPASPGPPAPPASPFRRAIAARYLRGL